MPGPDSHTVQHLLWLALAGATGTLARYGLSGLMYQWCGVGFPWGTMTVNLIGCFLFGLVFALGSDRMLLSNATRIVLLSGFMGGFTTFSSFGFDTSQMLEKSQWWLAASNVLMQNIGGVALMFAGIAVGRIL